MPTAPPSLSRSVPFCEDLFVRRRRLTRVVMVGDVGVGGDNPIRLQSMTTTPTRDTDATVAQALRLVQAGSEIVRITAPSEVDAANLKNIRAALRAKGVTVPLVADIHFRPEAALEAAEHVEKVRINPGNFVDAKAFKTREYTDREYAEELERIEERFTPLVIKLKRLGRALRIGTNHGSLSDRILNRYGDTPEGMVESALEFARICERNGYHDIIFSMKSSNPRVMIAAYRLLAARMTEAGMDYPFHLGVTEAGDGEDGRIKSAVGIGSLLEDGIGDTIRVSLTEEPEAEIPAARMLAAPYQTPEAGTKTNANKIPVPSPWNDFTSYRRRTSREIAVGPVRLGGNQPVRTVLDIGRPGPGLKALEGLLKPGAAAPPEILFCDIADEPDLEAIKNFRLKAPAVAFVARTTGGLPRARVLKTVDGILLPSNDARSEKPVFLEAPDAPALIAAARATGRSSTNTILSLAANAASLHEWRRLVADPWIGEQGFPLLLRARPGKTPEETLLASAVLLGGLLADGIGDAVAAGDLRLTYNILQGAGSRITKTEFISCPSCGRTLFDLQSTTERIKAKTGHLPGLKIAIMGCIVNGPGEMADADFGYVGGGPGKINLYVGKHCVEKGVPEDGADRRLVELIREHGKWTDPPLPDVLK